MAAEILYRHVWHLALHSRTAHRNVYSACGTAASAGWLPVGPIRSTPCHIRRVHHHDSFVVTLIATWALAGSAIVCESDVHARLCHGHRQSFGLQIYSGLLSKRRGSRWWRRRNAGRSWWILP